MRYMVITYDCGWDTYVDIYDNLEDAINKAVEDVGDYTTCIIYELGNEVMSNSQIKFLKEQMEG